MLTRISTPESTFYFETADEDVALDAYGRTAGYRSFDDLAFQLGKQADELRGELVIRSVTYADVVRDEGFLTEALEADVKDEGAETPFRSVEDWADWCVEGMDGDKARAFAVLHNLDADAVRIALREGLVAQGDLDAINAPFVPDLEDGLFASEDGTEPLEGDEALPSLFFHRTGGEVLRYWYTGQETYECHERREGEHGLKYWYGLGTRRIDDDMTADQFAEFEDVEEA